MPEPTSRASGARAINETGPPVTGRAEAEALAEAVAEAVALLALAVAVGLAVVLALGLYDCAKATDAKSTVPSMDSPINNSNFLTVFSLVVFSRNDMLGTRRCLAQGQAKLA